MTERKKSKVLLIVGPTASGKTRLSLQIARRCGGEIVSADSRQVYRYMDIGTAKPTPQELAFVPHHCIDIKDPDAFFSAGEYGRMARRIIDDILARGHTPIVVGGSGLYLRALVDGVFAGNYRDTALRNKLNEQAREEGLAFLYHRLCAVDPESCRKIHPNDQKRIVRALEVYEISGEPISRIQAKQTEPAGFDACFWGLRWPRQVLYRRVNDRVEAMVRAGLVEEVQKLRQMGYGLEYNSLNSVGYKEVFDYLDGRATLEKTVRLVQQNTRRFTKKQLTWFRKDSRIRWIDLEEPVNWDDIAQYILNSDAFSA